MRTTGLNIKALLARSRPLGFLLSIRAQLLALVFFLLLILIFSGYILQSALDGSLHTIQTQTQAIQALQSTTKASKVYTNLRWTYLTYLSSPNKKNYDDVEQKLAEFRASITPLAKSSWESDLPEIETMTNSLETTASQMKSLHPDSPKAPELEADATRTLGHIDEMLNSLIDKMEDFLSYTALSTREQTDKLHAIPVIFIIGGFLTILFATVVCIVSLFVPITKITRAMTAASINTDNARNYILPVPRRDEIGMVTAALNTLLIEVSGGIERIRMAERSLRETGQYVQAIMDNAADGIVTLNDQSIIETFSPSAEKLFRLPAAAALGTPVKSLLFDHKGAPFDLELYKEGRTPPSELMARTSEGVMIPVELAIGHASFAGRTIYIITMRDISARKQMESFVERAQRMETVGRMTGGIAHDFNNLLTVISGNFELIDLKIRNNNSDPVLKSMITMGLETVRKGKEMTQRLLAISSKQLLKPEPVNIAARLPAMVEMIRRAVREDVEIKTIVDKDIWNIRVDPVQLESALLNLCINARDALPATGGRIVIEATNIELTAESQPGITDARPGNYVMVAITDNGKGIAPDLLNRVFEPFFTTKEGSKGTGLGLSMVYGFTHQSGGYITIASTEGEGTTIRLFFPRTAEAVAADARQIAAADDHGIPTGTESLLVVEDEPDVLKYLTTTLRELGYRVTHASDAQSALKKLGRRKKLDLLVTDVVMPGEMNGEMLAQEATQRLPGLKVLFVSGYTRDALVEQGALKRGVNLLPKPFTRTSLAHAVRDVLDTA